MARHFPWDPGLETGHPLLDDQHRRLFELANELQDAAEDPEAHGDAVDDAVYRLAEYVVEHFGDEEAAMEAAGYPEVGPHRALHEYLHAHTLSIAARYFNGEDLRPDALAPFLTEWLTRHIELEDKRFAAFARAGGR